MNRKHFFLWVGLWIGSMPILYANDLSIPFLTLSKTAGGDNAYNLNLQIVILMTMITLLPGLLMATTAFTRIIIVLAILRQAMGLGQTPTNQIMIGMALFLTFFVMSPVVNEVNEKSVVPYLNNTLSMDAAMKEGLSPIRGFMLNQIRKNDLHLFEKLSGKTYANLTDVPMRVIMPAFITSELKTAFQIGFLIFIPFLMIDLIVASVLMAMGMMMLSPMMISLPFKIMLFVLVDGWTLILGSLASSFAGMT
jgi:flagellar biosynthetic protein FliP